MGMSQRAVLLVVALLAVCSECKLSLNMIQGPPNLALDCVFEEDDPLSSLVNLVIHNTTGGELHHVVASISALRPDMPYVGSPEELVVDYNLDTDQGSKLYLLVQWTRQSSYQSGTFECHATSLNVMNEENTVKDTVAVNPHPSSAVTALAEPPFVERGLTRQLTISCVVDMSFTKTLSEVSSISLYEIRDGARNEIWLSTVSQTSEASLQAGVTASKVRGFLDNRYTENYLITKWTNPDQKVSGLFECLVQGHDKNNNFLSFRDAVRVHVVDVTNERLRNELVKVSGELEAIKKAKDACELGHEVVDSCEDFESEYTGEHVVYLRSNRPGSPPVKTVCVVDQSGFPWTVFQKRSNGTENFNRTFAEYEEGFGDADDGEYWLGLEKIHDLLKRQQHSEMRIELDTSEKNYSFTYTTFGLGAAPGYTLTLAGALESDGKRFSTYHSGHPFETFDVGETECRLDKSGGWWYNDCYFIHLNKQNPSFKIGSDWFNTHFSRMMFRPIRHVVLSYKVIDS